MADQDHLTVGEFQRALKLGFDGVHARLDGIDEKLDRHGERLAVLEDRMGTTPAAKVSGRRARLAGWGTAAASTAIVLWEFVKGLLQAKGAQ